MKLEGIDPLHPSMFCVLTVAEVKRFCALISVKRVVWNSKNIMCFCTGFPKAHHIYNLVSISLSLSVSNRWLDIASVSILMVTPSAMTSGLTLIRWISDRQGGVKSTAASFTRLNVSPFNGDVRRVLPYFLSIWSTPCLSFCRSHWHRV